MTEPKKNRIKDLTGQRFGRLVVVNELPFRSKWGDVIWCCSCDCGNIVIVTACKLVSGHTKSCGCLSKENLSSFNNSRREEIKKMRGAGVKRCCSCKSIKKVDQFSKKRRYFDGIAYECKKCVQERNLSDKETLRQAKVLLKERAPANIELPPELIEARAELIKIRRTIREMTK